MEIEKKYLMRENGIESVAAGLHELYPSVEDLKDDVLHHGTHIRQGYLPYPSEEAIRLAAEVGFNPGFQPVEARLRDKAGKYYFTLKGNGGLQRDETEIELTRGLFDEYWPLTAGRRLEKVRLAKPYGEYSAEIDVYTDRDLVVAEIEVPTTENAESLPPLGRDVSDEPAYKNRNLAR